MKWHLFPSLFLLLAQTVPLQAQVFFISSNLPIVVITTNGGVPVPDEPKVKAHLGIIWNGDGELNNLSDPFNEYDGVAGIELRGSSSQMFPKKGYAIETRHEDGSNNNVSIFGFPEENDWVLHGPFSDKSLMRNALAYTLASWLMDYAPRVRFCELVLNGEYSGVYVFTEKIKRDAGRVDIAELHPDETTGDDLTGGYILKFDKWDGGFNAGFLSAWPSDLSGFGETVFQFHYPKPADIVPAQEAYIRQYIAGMEDALMSPDFAGPGNGYRRYFDMTSFFNYFFVQELGKNVDGYRLSTFFYKDKDSIDGKLKMGPVWDFNLAFGNADYCNASYTGGWAWRFNDVCPSDYFSVHFWWERMWQDTAYQREMKTRWFDLRNDTLSNERISGLIDSLETLLQQPALRNFERYPVLGQYVWPNAYIGQSFTAEVDYLRNWLTDRLLWLDETMKTVGLPEYRIEDYFPPAVYPNPFREEVKFEYYVRSDSPVSVDIYSINGQFVERLTDAQHLNGTNSLVWGSGMPAGIYFYRMLVNDNEVKKGKLVKN
jgi:CotH protein/type IX secretion system substrate protein